MNSRYKDKLVGVYAPRQLWTYQRISSNARVLEVVLG